MYHMNNRTFCATIGHRNSQYCGITKQWVPRLTKSACAACVVLPALFSLMCTIVGVPIIWRNFDKMELLKKAQAKVDAKAEADKKANKKKKLSWVPDSVRKSKLSAAIYLVPVLPLIWDTVDVVLDGVYFYNLEQGGMISSNITRNISVNNSLMAFAVLGSLKTPLLVLLIGQFWDVLISPKESEFTFKMVALSPNAIGNLYVSIVIYLTEDCAELFLEYFWIEKYIADHPSSVVVLRNVFTALISLVPLIGQLIKLKDNMFIAEQIECEKHKISDRKKRLDNGKNSTMEPPNDDSKPPEDKSKRQKIFICWVSLSVISLMSTIGSFLRAIGALYQLMSHTIPESCLAVTSDGLLIQNPFDDNCLRFIDYTVIFFNFLPLLIYTLFWLGSTIFKCCNNCTIGPITPNPITFNSNQGKPKTSKLYINIDSKGDAKYSIIVNIADDQEPTVTVKKIET